MIACGSEVLKKTNASSQETASTEDVIPSSTLDRSVRLRVKFETYVMDKSTCTFARSLHHIIEIRMVSHEDLGTMPRPVLLRKD